MKEIFISYSTIDSAQAETVRNVLEKNGISCWMAPRDIPGGSNYTSVIPPAIRNCKVFVLILSKNAQSSHWVLKELDAAVNNGKVILPFMLEDCILNDEFNFLLTGAQRYAAYQKTAEAMELLISRIRSILDVSAPSDPVFEANPSESAAPIPKEEPKKKASATIASLSFGDPVCPCCGGSELRMLKWRILRKGIQEWATMLFIPIFGAIGFFAAFFISTLIFLFTFDFTVGEIALVICALPLTAGGAFLGDLISRKIVHRQRMRQRITYACYSCNRCSKKFRIDTPNN